MTENNLKLLKDHEDKIMFSQMVGINFLSIHRNDRVKDLSVLLAL